MNAYDEIYLEKARTTLGNMLDYAVNGMRMNIREFWNLFLVSKTAEKIRNGDSTFIAGRSGVELCLELIKGDMDSDQNVSLEEKSPEYWAGWALAFYQWKTGLSFNTIDNIVPIEKIIGMYFPYHETDIRKFCDRMDELIKSAHSQTNIKRIRKSLGLTQNQLATQCGIPLRTIQQYEQGQKSINAARSEYLIFLAKALYCEPEDLLE